MKITLYWVTRKRPGFLSYSISSFLQNANNPSMVEILVVADDDDRETESTLSQINDCVNFISGNNIKFLQSQRHGYEYIDRYHNEAIKHSTGDCFVALMDDTFCYTRGWDDILTSSINSSIDKPTFIWVDCYANNYKNPGIISSPKMPRIWGINKKWYEKTQHLCGWRAGDDYFMHLVDRVKDCIEIAHPKFEILNVRKEDDETFKEGRLWVKDNSKRGPKTDDIPGQFERDVESLRGRVS